MTYTQWLHSLYLDIFNDGRDACRVCQSGACDFCNVYDKE